ncbi:hypothetical protein RI578_01380 [Streptomyces sp. BB1-1-1]|uniref:hypothetical protein n=1 Tax=Streptomyces sp. BB1-1-1 TaxID=3074430 RepID=UPI002877A113|nr:hypothetical protein [Streptomyces sp. BB1-1-1]WND33015.1 hypothetical protein RI578_01380 [Streptomyces sp. BB1-1-1]
MIVLPRSGRGMKRLLCALLLVAASLIAAGALTETLWLLGIGAWALIGAVLFELVYRP